MRGRSHCRAHSINLSELAAAQSLFSFRLDAYLETIPLPEHPTRQAAIWKTVIPLNPIERLSLIDALLNGRSAKKAPSPPAPNRDFNHTTHQIPPRKQAKPAHPRRQARFPISNPATVTIAAARGKETKKASPSVNHWAHRNREDGRKSPVAVLGWQRGRVLDPDTLQRSFRHLQIPRIINQHGLVSVQCFYIFAHRGLARQRVAVWIYEDRLQIEHKQTILARYKTTLDRRRKSLKTVSRPQIYATAFVSPQLELFELDEAQWHRAWLRPPFNYRQSQDPIANQLLLPGLKLLMSLALLWY